ncbi:hypothetical protein UT300003_32250 [Clostridium sardiniense]
MSIDEKLRKIEYHKEYRVQGTESIIIKDSSNIFWFGIKGNIMRSLNDFSLETKKDIVEKIIF